MKRIKALIFALGILISTNLSAVTLTPSTFGENIDYGDSGYKEYKIKNDSSEIMRYKMVFSGNEDKFDIQVYPKVVLLEPFEEKKIKVLIKKKENVVVSDGEYKFSAMISPIKVPTLSEKNVTSGEVGINPNVGVAIGLGMYGYVGDLGNPKEDIKISNMLFDKKTKKISFVLNNTMKRSFKLTIAAFENRKDYELKTDIIRIAAGKSEKIEVQVEKLKNVDYVELYDTETDKLIQTIKL